MLLSSLKKSSYSSIENAPYGAEWNPLRRALLQANDQLDPLTLRRLNLEARRPPLDSMYVLALTVGGDLFKLLLQTKHEVVMLSILSYLSKAIYQLTIQSFAFVIIN